PPGYYKRLCHGKDQEWIDCYVRGKYPKAEVGSYYGDLISALQERGGLEPFVTPNNDVFTSWDLGLGDATSIWFWRFNKERVPEFIDWYENNGRPMSHYFQVIEERGYSYTKHWLPHDARAKTLQTGESIMEQCLREWGADKVSVVPRL